MRAFLRSLGIFLALGAWAPPALAQGGVGGGGGPTPEAIPTAGPTTFIPGRLEAFRENRADGQAFDVERVVIGVPAVQPEVIYTMTAGGATMYAAHLQKDRFQRDALPEMSNVPKDKVEAGPIDIVTTWDPGFLPFRVDFKELAVPDPVTRVLRRATGASIKDGSIVAPTRAKADAFVVNRPIAAGDLLVVTAPAEVAGEYQVNLVGPGGSITPVKPFAVKDAAGVAYEVKRTGDFGSLFLSDPYFVRTSKEPGFPLVYVWPDPTLDVSPFYIEKRFTAGSNPYSLNLTVTLHNFGDKAIQALPGLKVSAWQHPDAKGGGMFARPTNIQGATCHTNESLEHADFPSLQSQAIDNLKAGGPAIATNAFTTPTDFIGVDTAYFAALAAPVTRAPTGQCQQGMAIYDANTPGAWSLFATYYVSAAQTVSPGANGCWPEWKIAADGTHRSCDVALNTIGLKPDASTKDVDAAWRVRRNEIGADVSSLDKARQEIIDARQSSLRYDFILYTGPKDQNLLAQTAPILQRDVDLGIFEFIAKPLHSLLVWLHGGVGHWALAIILLTFIVKLVLLPLTNKSYRSMQKMQQLKPKLDEIKKRLDGDKQKFAQEQMALFKREGVNPLTGCFPMLLQMPVWFGLYQSIQTSVELYHAPMGLWINDLSAPDPFFIMPILLGVLMFVQTLLTATATMDGLQGKIMKYGMPIMFSAFMLFLPSGLVLYIFVNVALTIVQNLVIKRRMSTP
ncbi:MAG: hypothetical protein CVU56_05405 [Deltaproteobacteria bacterium HGW-Deltaproteobacteria-14]|jgi:YidC/Oxa1 family membrane protein insertase|nr:MAG: hypothetical protein CVU56_05405 [Deltaproteobacteria bacterium HGW-Deltaproteobacteria-14]